MKAHTKKYVCIAIKQNEVFFNKTKNNLKTTTTTIYIKIKSRRNSIPVSATMYCNVFRVGRLTNQNMEFVVNTFMGKKLYLVHLKIIKELNIAV